MSSPSRLVMLRDLQQTHRRWLFVAS